MSNRNEDRRTPVVRWPLAVAFLVTLGCALWNPYVGSRPHDGVGYAEPTSTRPTRAASKTRIEGDKQYLWAKGPRDPKAEASEWFDLTGSPLPLDGFQYGIGRDTIRSIDHPVFVKADDPRLRLRWGQRKDADIDDLPVIGYVHKGVARAYPVPLLNHHELVNDTVGGKPVTVGW